jgi:type IV conjugative transfer system protein TraE
MDQTVLKKNLNKISGQRNGFLFFSIILSIVVLILSLLLFTKKERIVIVPTSGTSFWIEEGKASSGYIEKMGLFLSDLLLNRSPVDVEKRNGIILQYVHPASYHEIRKHLLQEQESLLKGDQSYYFHAEKNYADAEQNAFTLVGDFVVVTGKEGRSSSVSQTGRKKFTLKFACESGKLLLKSLKKEEA